MANRRVYKRAAHVSPLRDFEVEEVRSQIPIARYMSMLHLAAVTGKVPVLDENGDPTGEAHAINGDRRIDTARYLIDKRMPAPAPVQPDAAPEDPLLLDREDVRHLSAEKLRALAFDSPRARNTEREE